MARTKTSCSEEQNPRRNMRFKHAKSFFTAMLLPVVTLGVLAWAGVTIYVRSPAFPRRVAENTRQYVEANISNIMKEQEEKLGIKHFGIPEIAYGLPIDLEVDSLFTGFRNDAIYDAAANKIYLSNDGLQISCYGCPQKMKQVL